MKKIFALLFLCSTSFIFAGNFKMGKVSKEELEERQHPLDPAADAAILYKKGNTHFDIDGGRWVIITEVEVRVKIYTKNGYDRANVAIPYYYKRVSGESVTFSDAVTYNLVNGEIQKTALKNGDEFTEEVTTNRRKKKIMLPNVKERSVIEYKYVIKSPYIHNFPDWYFQEKIPVNYVEYCVNIPQLFVYNRIINSYFELEESTELKRRTVLDRMSRLSFQEIKQTYSIKDLPAFKTESFIDNADNYRLYVKHELASSTNLDEKETKYTTTWESVAKTLYTDDDFGNQLKKESYFKEDIDAIISGIQSDDKKLELIFNYVKNRMSWTGRYGFFCYDGVKKAYDEHSGSCADINIMLTSMLRYAGLEANPVLISTRDNGFATYASLGAYNYVLTGVELNDKIILLDATEKVSSPDILPVRDLNGSGWLLRKDYTWSEVKLNPSNLSREVVFLTAFLSADGNIKGKLNCKYSDYNALTYKLVNQDLNIDEHLQKLESWLGDVEISDLEFDVNDDKSAQVTVNFTTNGFAEVVGDKIYLSPLMFYGEDESKFNEEKRLYPLDFVYPSQSRYNFVITIPEEYVI